MDRRLLILWFTIFIDLIGFTLFIPVVPYFAGAIGASDAVVMLSAALFSIMVFMCSPINALRSSGVLAAIILSCISCMAFMWLAIRAISGVVLPGMDLKPAAEAAPAG